MDEVLDDLSAVRAVYHLGVELHSEQTPLRVLHRSHRRKIRAGHRVEPLGYLGHGVVVAHPDRLLQWKVGKQKPPGGLQCRRTELGASASRNHAAELRSHELVPVANAQYRYTAVEQMW